MTINQALALPPLLKRERRRLLRAILGFSETDLFLRAERELTPDQEALYLAYSKRRLAGEPMAYILGQGTFYQRDFYVTPDVLIPRPETEALIEDALKLTPQSVLDLCTGSGILGITLQKELGVKVTAGDISPGALRVARRNADRHRATVELFESDLFSNITGCYDLIITNPPYIDVKVLPELEVSRYEPTLALDGGVGGLEVYQKIIPQAKDHLNDGGILLMEIGYDQAKAITELLIDNGYHNIQTRKDLAGFDRVVQAEYRRES